MHAAITPRHGLAAALFASAAAWPFMLSAWLEATRTPLERAMASAFCGAAPHAAKLHCAACWTGAAALLLAVAWCWRAANSRRFSVPGSAVRPSRLA
jgi:hypothetical protein